MDMKDFDFKPELQIVKFGTVDIVRTSTVLDEDELPDYVFPTV